MNFLLFLYLVLFPFGKLTGILPDLIIFSIFLLNFKKFKLNQFLIVAIFSLIFSLTFFKITDIFIGGFYLLRLIAYFSLANFIYKDKKVIFNSLILVGLCVAIFGFFQYFIFPDLTSLKTFGW